jgi:hypothetical protein
MDDQLKELITAGSEERVNELLSFCESVQIVTIETNEQYVEADKTLAQIKKGVNIIETERTVAKKPLLYKGSLLDAWYNVKKRTVEGFRDKLSSAMTVYEKAVEAKRREEQRKLDLAAEQERREKEAAAQRERDKADALRKEAEELAKKDRAAADALLVKAANADARADVKEQKAFEVEAKSVQVDLPKTTSYLKDNWKMYITDARAFVEHCAKNNLLFLLQPNETACNNHAKTLRCVQEYPGAEIVNEQSRVSKPGTFFKSLN